MQNNFVSLQQNITIFVEKLYHMSNNNTKWVACWGNATSITNRSEAIYAKNLTLRYPVRMPFSGSQLRFRFSNLTGTEPVTLNKYL